MRFFKISFLLLGIASPISFAQTVEKHEFECNTLSQFTLKQKGRSTPPVSKFIDFSIENKPERSSFSISTNIYGYGFFEGYANGRRFSDAPFYTPKNIRIMKNENKFFGGNISFRDRKGTYLEKPHFKINTGRIEYYDRKRHYTFTLDYSHRKHVAYGSHNMVFAGEIITTVMACDIPHEKWLGMMNLLNSFQDN